LLPEINTNRRKRAGKRESVALIGLEHILR
jgi:hypothetical protein